MCSSNVANAEAWTSIILGKLRHNLMSSDNIVEAVSNRDDVHSSSPDMGN